MFALHSTPRSFVRHVCTVSVPLALASIFACSPEQSVGTTASDLPVALAKGGGSASTTPDSRASFVWESSGMSVVSDAGAYEGGVGSVLGRIWYYDASSNRGGAARLDPDANGDGSRKLVFKFPGGDISSGAIATFEGLMQLGSNARDSLINSKNPTALLLSAAHPEMTALQPAYPAWTTVNEDFRFKATGISGCAELAYTSIRLTRTAGSFVSTTNGMGKWVFENQPGEWIVESVPSERNGQFGHWATCWTTIKNKLTANGSYSMPFRVTVTEVR